MDNTLFAVLELFTYFENRKKCRKQQSVFALWMNPDLCILLSEKERENRMEYQEEKKRLLTFNEDELFYKAYYQAGKSQTKLKEFLAGVDRQVVIDRHLVVPEIFPNIISYNMEDDEYFSESDRRSVYISRHNRYTPAFLHRHSFFEIVHVLSGHCSQTIGLNNLTFYEGDVCLIAPGTFHTMEVFDDDSLVFNILLRRSTFYQMFTPLTLGDHLLSEFFSEGLYEKNQIEYLVFHTGKNHSYNNSILSLWLEQEHRDEYTDQILVGRLTSMNALMMRNFRDTMESSFSQQQLNMPENFLVMSYIQEHLADVTLADVADHFGFSVSYCSRLIKATTGQGFNDWKRTLRLRRSEHLLINSNQTVADISSSLGYSNPETFIRAFRKEFHVSPTQYRRQMGKN